MKIFLLTALLFVLAFEAFAQIADREVRGFKGPVKSVSIESTTVSVLAAETISKTPLIKQQISFDKEGRTIEEILFDAGGNMFEKSVFEYETDGSKIQTRYKSDGTTEQDTFRYKYDSSGRVKIVKRTITYY